MNCPQCNQPVVVTQTKYGRRNDCRDCNLWSWGNHPLVDGETHDARKKAHAAFDPLWMSRKMTRRKAYKALSNYLGIPESECHMKLMPKEIAQRVPLAVSAITVTPTPEGNGNE